MTEIQRLTVFRFKIEIELNSIEAIKNELACTDSVHITHSSNRKHGILPNSVDFHYLRGFILVSPYCTYAPQNLENV